MKNRKKALGEAIHHIERLRDALYDPVYDAEGSWMPHWEEENNGYMPIKDYMWLLDAEIDKWKKTL